jgi:hypothetical protein
MKRGKPTLKKRESKTKNKTEEQFEQQQQSPAYSGTFQQVWD